MSPVNEEEPVPQPTLADRFAIRSRTLMGASDRMPIRVLILFTLTAMCVTLAPIPANLIGVAALSLLALDTAVHRR